MDAIFLDPKEMRNPHMYIFVCSEASDDFNMIKIEVNVEIMEAHRENRIFAMQYYRVNKCHALLQTRSIWIRTSITRICHLANEIKIHLMTSTLQSMAECHVLPLLELKYDILIYGRTIM